MNEFKDWRPNGILNPRAGEQKFRLVRHAPAEDLASFVARYWIASWDLRGQAPYLQENIPHPCVNLVVEQDKSSIYGVTTGRSEKLLKDSGRVFGVKFRPGAFYPFVKRPVSQLNDSSLSLQAVFGVDGQELEEAVLPVADEGRMVEVMENFLRQRLPERDEMVAVINRIVEGIIAEREITKVDDVVRRFHISKRTLQRLFSRYVGVSPKWVIKRYRLHEAAGQLAGTSSRTGRGWP
jgi:hypothetical protein